MGMQKPNGQCWSGACANLGTISAGTDTDGIECKVCASCDERTKNWLRREATLVAIDLSERTAAHGALPQAHRCPS